MNREKKHQPSDAVPETPKNGPQKIILIDDDPLQLDLLQGMLTVEGYEVVGYEDAQKALENVAYDNPDMVLTDLVMPGIDGFEVIRRLKADEATRQIPVVVVTGQDDQGSESKGLALGAVDYITKPFDRPIVKARVEAHLEIKRHHDELELLVRQRTAELSSSRQQFQDLVEKSLVGIAIIQDGQVVYQNPELRRIIADFDEKVPKLDVSFIHPHDLKIVKQAYTSLVLKKTQQVEMDIRILASPGEELAHGSTWINCRAVLYTYQGRGAILVNIVDITHTKELERLLLIRNKMTSLGRIAAGMAHEIRNPLTGITAYLYSLEQMSNQPTLSPKDHELMHNIVGQLKTASRKVDAVLKRMLDFAKPTAPRMVRLNMNKCLDAVLQLNTVTLRKAGIEVNRKLASDLPHCYGDPALLEQVIMNLIQNAARAMKQMQTDKQISIKSYNRNRQVCFDVTDTGPGVPDELKGKIFDPFFTTSAAGSGIGLSIAQRIVANHNGSLVVETCQGGGARFTVSIPIEKRKIKR